MQWNNIKDNLCPFCANFLEKDIDRYRCPHCRFEVTFTKLKLLGNSDYWKDRKLNEMMKGDQEAEDEYWKNDEPL